MNLRELLGKSVTVEFDFPVSPEALNVMTGGDAEVVAHVKSLVASAMGYPAAASFSAGAIQAALYQDDDAHDTCTLIACLNPLHPGPCKGWKGTLHDVSPGAWHALEAARVEKANHARIKKIEALKAQGKPIPHKLLQPIVAKPNPHAGKTANAATGEAHAAGQAVSDAAGVHVNEPGKVTLGQAVKVIPQNTGEKGPKGKKPTLGSKGIAFVIAQEKVTPQYKLDKTAKITPEQWAALSHDDKAVIRGELAKIQKDGFGPQQKKAAELLAKLNEPKNEAPVSGLKPGAPDTITTPSGKTYQKVTLRDAQNGPKPETAPHHVPKFPDQPLSAKNYTPAMKDATDAAAMYANPPKIHALQMGHHERFKAYQKLGAEEWKALPDGTKTTIIKDVIGMSASDQHLHQGFMTEDGKAFTPASAWLARRNIELPALEQNRINKFVPQFSKGKPVKPAVQVGIPEKTLVEAKHTFGEDSKITKVTHPQYGSGATSSPGKAAPKPADLTPGTPGTVTTPSGKTYQKVTLKDEAHTPSAPAEPKPEAPATPAAPAAAKKEKHVYTVVHDGETITRTSTADYTHASLVQKGTGGPVVVWGFHKSEANALSTPLTSMQKKNGFKVVAALPVTKHEGGKPKGPEAKKAEDLNAPGSADKIGNLTPGAPGTITTPSGKVYQRLGETVGHKIENKAEKPKELPKHVQEAVAMANGHAPGASWSKNHLAAYQKLSAEEFAALPGDTQDKIIAELKKGGTKFLDPKKIQASSDLLKKFKGGLTKGATPKVAESAPTHMTPTNLVKQIQKHGTVKITHDGIDHVVGFENSGPQHAHLIQVSTIGTGTGHYVIKPPNGPSIHLGKNEQVTVHGPASTPPPKTVSFTNDLHDHSVTTTQAKETADAASTETLFNAAKSAIGLTGQNNPDAAEHKAEADKTAKHLAAIKLASYDADVVNDPAAKAAVKEFEATVGDHLHAQAVQKAKASAYNRISKALADDKGHLSPLEKAALVKYQSYVLQLKQPVDTSKPRLDKLQLDATKALAVLEGKLQDVKKKHNGPSVADMSPAQVNSEAEKLLGPESVNPKVNLTMAEIKHAGAGAQAQALAEVEDNYPLGVAADPQVAAKIKELSLSLTQLNATKASEAKLAEHLANHHDVGLTVGKSVAGTPLTAHDKQVIEASKKQLTDSHNYLNTVKAQQETKVALASAALHSTAGAAQAKLKPAEPAPAIKLTDFDVAAISDAYSEAWASHASKAVLYGVKSYSQKLGMKAHPDYVPLMHDLGNLRALSGKVALAHAIQNTTKLNVPTDPDTGVTLPGPEHKAWIAAVLHTQELEDEFRDLHKVAQARLDNIRADAGLKKRALPKADSPAVKAAAAETGFYKSGGYSGPNYGKPQAAKHYMVAKVGPKHAVAHQSAAEKKLAKESEKLGGGTSTTSKIENVVKGEPVKLGTPDATISHIPDALKKTITADFKAMPKGKYLQDPTEDIFGNLVNLAAAHGKGLPDGLSVDQVVKTIDETHSKNLGVENGGMLHKKVTDWLGTTAGKQYAEAHSAPDAKAVKQLTGEIELPKGVTLAPGEKVQKVAGPGAFDESLKASAFHPATASEAQATQEAYMKAQGVKWSPEQKQAIKAYTGNGHGSYSTFNDYLRGDGTGTAATRQSVVNIQAAMMPLQGHTLLKRGSGWAGLPFNASNAHLQVGKTFEDPAFVSTTVAGSSGHFSGKPLQLVIEAPKGTSAAFVNGISQYKGTENEMLLAAGTKFKVISVEVKGGQTFMRVRIVGGK